jgi:hypothetical protein
MLLNRTYLNVLTSKPNAERLCAVLNSSLGALYFVGTVRTPTRSNSHSGWLNGCFGNKNTLWWYSHLDHGAKVCLAFYPEGVSDEHADLFEQNRPNLTRLFGGW